MTKQTNKNCKKTITIFGGLVSENPKKIGKITTQYPSTMSDDWFEHLLTKIKLIK